MNCVAVYVFFLLCFCVNLYPCKGLSQNEQKLLDAHNKYRRMHNAPALTINTNMSAKAAAWAKHLLSLGALQHHPHRDGDGENLFYDCSAVQANVEESTDEWYREVHNYDFDKHRSRNGFPVLRFTQLVWKNSRELGIGVATGTKGRLKCTFVVARYRPLGNVPGQYSTNVSRRTFEEYDDAVQNGRSGSGSDSSQGSGSGTGSSQGSGSGSDSSQGSGSGSDSSQGSGSGSGSSQGSGSGSGSSQGSGSGPGSSQGSGSGPDSSQDSGSGSGSSQGSGSGPGSSQGSGSGSGSNQGSGSGEWQA